MTAGDLFHIALGLVQIGVGAMILRRRHTLPLRPSGTAVQLGTTGWTMLGVLFVLVGAAQFAFAFAAT